MVQCHCRTFFQCRILYILVRYLFDLFSTILLNRHILHNKSHLRSFGSFCCRPELPAARSTEGYGLWQLWMYTIRFPCQFRSCFNITPESWGFKLHRKPRFGAYRTYFYLFLFLEIGVSKKGVIQLSGVNSLLLDGPSNPRLLIYIINCNYPIYSIIMMTICIKSVSTLEVFIRLSVFCVPQTHLPSS